MEAIPIVGPIISGLSKLASKIIDVWHESKQKKLDREHQKQLLEAQHRHERFLESIKYKRLSAEFDYSGLDRDFLGRLSSEAESLSEMGFDVVFEPVSNGYGLALPTGEITIVFWIPQQYPHLAPSVFLKTFSKIEKIDFDQDAWQADRTIAEVVTALIESDLSVLDEPEEVTNNVSAIQEK